MTVLSDHDAVLAAASPDRVAQDLFESRVVLDPARPQALASILAPVMRRSAVQHAHRMIWTLFADTPERARDFLYLVESHRPFTAIVRSRRPPVDGVGGIWRIERSYRFAPRIEAGQRLRFRLRAVATKWQPQPGKRRGKRQDVMVTAWVQLPEAERTPERLEVVAERAGLDWLAGQGTRHGFAVAVAADAGEVVVVDYQRERFPGGSGKPIVFGAVTFEGLLTVTDPHAFRQTLADGLGAARGFGNGLLQIAPAPHVPA